ncbi:probable ATP-dependent RNA helicase DDX20 [Drosophila santomea]|uniref:probable ATP-dependent RNA helicase DDX20 n=1 Tax=Drosophila santomea TaxID=129105 RepID=UPI001954BB88|nr:probable ATP-dependent RNA helicase DDX20 [Drosophila santomea]
MDYLAGNGKVLIKQKHPSRFKFWPKSGKSRGMEREIAHSVAGEEQRSSDVAPGQVKTFEELRLSRNLLNGLKRHNFVTPTKIQAAAIPMALTNMDLIVQSKSGTGKTLIYVIAAMQGYHAKMTRPHALIVVPTRELAIQVQDTFFYLCESYRDFKCSAFIGGTEVAKDRRRMQASRIIIGTPGRLLHLYQNRVLDVSKLGLLVLDEADQLYQTKSLQDTVSKLIQALPKNRQIIACSATYDQDLDVRLAKIMNKPMLISNSERATVLLGIRQFVYELPQQTNSVEEMRLKLKVLAQIFNQLPYEQAVLFASSQMRADSYKNYLTASGVECHLISGAMEQSERLNVFEGYRNFTMRTLVATDLMARGVDSPHANLVINIDPPQDHVTYLHRIGRAGRFGSKGIAITFIASEKESQKFREMSRKVATAWSVLEFPKEPMPKEFNFWDFEKYNFGYYIKEENPRQEMPVKHKVPKTDIVGKKPEKRDPEKSNVVAEKLPVALENVESPKDREQMSNNVSQKKEVELDNQPETSHNNKKKQVEKEIAKQGNLGKAEDSKLTKSERSKKSICPSKLFTSALSQIEKQNTEVQQAPEITVNEYYIDNDIDECIKPTADDKENQPDNGTVDQFPTKTILNPVEIISPELTPTLTPLDLTQEPSPTTVTPPAPPANSINNKTYCLAAPSQTSSMTIQNMAISNTVDDASSISSDSMGCGYQSDGSYDTFYATSDEEEIWERLMSKRRRHLKNGQKKRRVLLYKKERPKHNANVKRKFKEQVRSLYRSKKSHLVNNKVYLNLQKRDLYKRVSLLPHINLCHLLQKVINQERILKRLHNYAENHNMDKASVAKMLDDLYKSILELYYANQKESKKLIKEAIKEVFRSIDHHQSHESLISEKPEPKNKFSVHVTNQIDIPPMPAQPVDEMDSGSESDTEDSQEYDEGEEISLDDEDDGSDAPNSSSGFVETNESASSGIDTSVYETESTGLSGNDYGASYFSEDESENDEYESDAGSSTSSDAPSNVSLAGSSSPGSRAGSSSDKSSDDDSITVTNVIPVQNTTNNAQSIWRQTFNMQYQFIANHVAKSIQNYN